ncbi:tRNA pseudouridine(65) synthase TruC [Bowmanella dokdonensis]|uniref:tRNA pseudouridine synthase C n=2 Tax=Bowmanella dokdonensis TaxID=751969 RepID=A0A939DLB9_9ALTE|nr:tRNA pseudouridine(65) synthase TruC [Bowmanella dokdonensis]
MSWQRTEALETVFQVLVEFDRLYQPLEQLQILYRDESLIAVNKPAGLLVHRSLIDKYETRFAVQALRDQIGQRVYPVHRLDKPTSGVLLFALNPEMARSMTELFTTGRVEKRYQALVRGFTPDEGMIDYPLREKLDKIADKRARKDKPAQPALSLYRTLQRFELPIPVRPYQSARYSLVELWPKTGRKHQLRRHMAHLRHPIVGDVNHGDGKHNAMVRDRFGFVGLALTACEMNFEHPRSRQMIKITCGTEDRFQALLAKWRDFGHSPPYIEPASQREE